MLVFGVAAFAVVAPLQLRVMNAAGHAPDVASAANISAFTLGSAIGIALGGQAIDGGLGLTSVNWVGGLITTTGLVVALITWAMLDRRTVAAPARDQRTQDYHHEPHHQGGRTPSRTAVTRRSQPTTGTPPMPVCRSMTAGEDAGHPTVSGHVHS